MDNGSGNGLSVITLGRRGRRAVRLDEGFPEVVLDVVLVANQWVARDQAFRDAEGKVPPERAQEFYGAAWEFAAETLQLGPRAPELSLADALHFLKVITDEAQALRGFFEPASGGGPSSRGSTELTFSQEEG
jgi:hypothetical protein